MDSEISYIIDNTFILSDKERDEIRQLCEQHTTCYTYDSNDTIHIDLHKLPVKAVLEIYTIFKLRMIYLSNPIARRI